MKTRIFFVIIGLLLTMAVCNAIDRGVPMPSGRRVADFSGVLDKKQKWRMRRICSQLENENDIGLTVVIIKMALDWIQSGDLDAFSKKVFSEWNTERDSDGFSILLVVADEEKDYRVLYGPKVPSYIKQRVHKVCSKLLTPAIAKQPADAAIVKGVKALSIVLRGPVPDMTFMIIISIYLGAASGILIIVLLVILKRPRQRVRQLSEKIMSWLSYGFVSIVNRFYCDEDRDQDRRMAELKIKEDREKRERVSKRD
jgi:uncharacterized membrane protein YgcG